MKDEMAGPKGSEVPLYIIELGGGGDHHPELQFKNCMHVHETPFSLYNADQ